MARTFPLAGLLGLRRLEEHQAATALSAANHRTGAIEARRGAALRELDGSPSWPADAETLRLAAYVQAREDLQTARARTIGLEKLEEKHTAAALAGDLRTEQIGLDEIASGSWQRQKESINR
jgi:flagellar FliJ protein